MTRVLVDSDVLAYACGGATQTVRYNIGVIYPDGTEDEAILDSMDAVRAWKQECPEYSAFTEPTRLVEPEPESHAIHLVNKSLLAIIDTMEWAGIKFDKLELFMTGEGNFREKIATIKPYKGNRDRNQRPYHYAAIRRYLSRAWGAKTVCGYEADDALSIEYHREPDNVIIVSQDKDLSTFPGKKYNARTKKWAEVSPEQARLNFYRQLITGDPTDNIGGCYLAGPAKASKLAEDMDESSMYEHCRFLYEGSVKKAGCPYVEMGWEAALLENARLLHMLRHEGDVWNPPIS